MMIYRRFPQHCWQPIYLVHHMFLICVYPRSPIHTYAHKSNAVEADLWLSWLTRFELNMNGCTACPTMHHEAKAANTWVPVRTPSWKCSNQQRTLAGPVQREWAATAMPTEVSTSEPSVLIVKPLIHHSKNHLIKH